MTLEEYVLKVPKNSIIRFMDAGGRYAQPHEIKKRVRAISGDVDSFNALKYNVVTNVYKMSGHEFFR